ncbi:MAG: AMP-binding protein [Zhongshania sp.]|jgi:acyl-CoA synthetase (AMP-forming)/AMP-acid ligase II|nr:AMP-binding protein [Zhongshania sp.]
MWLFNEIQSLGDIPLHYAGHTPDAPALIGMSGTVTWRALNARANQMSHVLAELGIQSQDRMAILGGNSVQYFELLFGASKLDATFLPLNWRLAVPELQDVVEDAAPRLLFADSDFAEIAAKIASSSPTACRVVVYNSNKPDEGELATLATRASEADPEIDVNPLHTCILMYTSGTTGRPKGVQQSHQNHLYLRLCEHLEPSFQYRASDCMLTVMPLFHAMGLSLSLQALYNGASVAVYPMPDPVILAGLITQIRPTVLPLIPTAVQMLIDHPDNAEADLSSVRLVVYAGSSITVPVLKRAIQRLGCEFIQFYGATETCSGVTFLRPADHRLDDEARLKSCGAPLPLMEIRVANEQGEELPNGQVGEFLIRSPSLCEGYRGQPVATAAAFRDGWYRSGDAGYRDEAGLLYIVDRVKDMIISGGENVYSTEVEQAVQKLAEVALCAAVGVPDPKWGERVTVAVVRQLGTELDEAKVIEHCRGLIAGYKVPKRVVFLESLPMTPSGKVMKKILREDLQKITCK